MSRIRLISLLTLLHLTQQAYHSVRHILTPSYLLFHDSVRLLFAAQLAALGHDFDFSVGGEAPGTQRCFIDPHGLQVAL